MNFEHLGYFEEFMLLRDGCNPKGIGARMFPVELPPEQQGRTLGAYGKREFEVTQTITLSKGHRQVEYKASVKRPLRVSTMLQRLEGQKIESR